MGYWWFDGTNLINLRTGAVRSTFTSGVTQPFYVEGSDPLTVTSKNVGAFGQLTPYSGTPNASGIIQISTPGLYENLLFSHPTEVRAEATFKNCMWLIPPTWTFAKPFAVVSILNGSGANNVVFEDVEIHNRAQRALNGIMGRNFVMRRSVVTGAVDPWSDSSAGSAPLSTRGFEVYDSIAPSVAFWYSSTNSPEIHTSDLGSHSDVYQSNTTLEVLFDNTVMAGYVSEFIGTGTPGSGSDAGNTYVPPSGYNYIQSQAQMEAWRNAHANTWTTPSQSMWGDSRRLASSGSVAGIMLNLGSVTARHCYFGGGTVSINAVDPDVVGSTVHLIDNVFWNDMLNGHGSNPAQKGHAILASTAFTPGTDTGNRWADAVGGAALTRQLEGGFAIWR